MASTMIINSKKRGTKNKCTETHSEQWSMKYLYIATGKRNTIEQVSSEKDT